MKPRQLKSNTALMEDKEIINKSYDSPLDFIRDYTTLVSNQINSPKKIFYHEINYSSSYEHDLFSYVLRLTQPSKVELKSFKEIEELLFCFRKLEYYDVVFYEASLLHYIKGVAILLDRLENDIETGCFENVGVYYYFCSSNIDLNSSLLEVLKGGFNEKAVCDLDKQDLLISDKDLLANLSEAIHNINLALKDPQQSFIAGCEDLKRRYVPSDKLIGDSRVFYYTIGDCVIQMIVINFQSSEDKYVAATKILSELTMLKIGNEDDWDIIKGFADGLLT